MPNTHSLGHRRLSLPVGLLATATLLTTGACNSTKPKEYNPPEASQARCAESHSADGACAAAEAADE